MNELFDRIEGRIREFGDSRASVLRWGVDPDDRPWIRKVLDDRFPQVRVVTAEATTRSNEALGFGLARSAFDSLANVAGANGPIRPPSMTGVSRDVDAFACVLDTYARGLGSVGKALVAEVELTFELAETKAVAGWWTDLLRTSSSVPVRFLVLEDRRAASPFDRIDSDVASTVLHDARPLGVPEALEALAESIDGRTIEGRTRLALMRAMHACKRQDERAAAHHATEATALAREAQRPELAIAGWFSVGAMAMGRSDPRAAVERYRLAETLATEAVGLQRPIADVLLVQSRMGTGAALFGGGGYELAAKHFLDTVPMARDAGEVRLEVECARLAGEAFVFARRGDPALDAGITGLKTLARVPDGERPKEAGRELGRFLVRLTSSGSNSHHQAGIRTQLERLLGPRWNEG